MNVEPAQTQEEGQEVFGPDTPPPGRAEANAREVEHRLGDLWEDGQDHLVEMMTEAVRIAYEHAETNAVLTTGMRLLWGSIAGYGQHRPHRVLLPPRWLQWIQGKIEVAMNEDAEATVEHEVVGLLHLLPPAEVQQQVVRDDAQAEGREEMVLMQVDTPRARGRRPQEWIRILDGLRHMTPRIRQLVIGKLRGWLGRRLQGLGKDVGALAGMYRNVTEGPAQDECAAEPRCSEDGMENPEPGTPQEEDVESDTVAADTLAAGFIHALETEWLSVLAEADSAEEVMAGMAVEVARRLDRVGEPEPAGVDPVSGDVMERENMTVGFRASRWLRQRISRPWRGLVYREVLRQVRLQVGQEARHLRRLHMALGAFEMMQVEDEDGNPTEEDRATIHREAKELVDDLIVWVSQGMRLKRTVLEMLQGSGSASSSAPAEQPHDDVEELQRLRWWLNVLLEGDYLPTPLGAPAAEDGEEANADRLHSHALPPGAEEENGTDDVAWVQTPPPWKDTRGRSRSRSAPRTGRRGGDHRTQAGRAHTGGPDSGGRPGGEDGNDHRPWRRDRRWTAGELRRGCPAERRTGEHSRGTSSRAPMPPRTPPPRAAPTLPEDFRQYAWHCLLQMADPFSSPARYSYGITEASRQNIQATFDEMEEAERGLMMVELLRVLGLLLTEVAEAIAVGAGYRRDEGTSSSARDGRDDTVEVPYEDEPDETGLVQTELKRAKLARASEPQDLTNMIMMESHLRGLIEVLEGLSADGARRGAQEVYNRLHGMYGPLDGGHCWPASAEGVASAMVTFGVDGMEAVDLTGEESRLLHFWWSLLSPRLPPGPVTIAATGSTTSASTAGLCAGVGDVIIVENASVDSGNTCHGMGTAEPGEVTDATVVEYAPTELAGEDAVEDGTDELVQELEAMMDHMEGSDDCGLEPVTSKEDLLAMLAVPGHTPHSILPEAALLLVAQEAEAELREQRAMEVEAERARRYADWDTWSQAVASLPAPRSLEVQVRTRVRSQGMPGSSRALVLRLQPGDTLEVAIAVSSPPTPGPSEGPAVSDADVHYGEGSQGSHSRATTLPTREVIEQGGD